MKRRDVLMAGGALAAAGAASAPAREHEDEHGHEGHHGHGPLLVKNPLLVEAAAGCVNTGQACLKHCLALFVDGNAELARCAQKVNELQAACGALLELANMDSDYLASYARVTMQVCRDCEEECRKHETKHAVCKACAEACLKCYDECDIIAA